MRTTDVTLKCLPQRNLRFGCYLLAIASLGLASCARITSTKVGDVTSKAWPKPPAAYGRYYLPIPYLEVYAFKSALVKDDSFLQIVVRPVVKPDVRDPIVLEQKYSGWVQQNMAVSFTPEGFLEHVGLYREPKQAEAAVAIGRTVMALAGPLPLPVKGLPELPEFSTLIHQELLPLSNFTEACPSTNLNINGSSYRLSVTYATNPRACNRVTRKTPDSPAPFDGVYYRPLIPVTVQLQELRSRLVSPVDSKDLKLEQVLYCPDPSTIDRFQVPKAFLAKQGVDLRFSGGTLYEIETSRDAEWLELAKVPLQIIGGVAAVPSAVFNFKVETTHKGESARKRGGTKDPGGNRPPIEKE